MYRFFLLCLFFVHSIFAGARRTERLTRQQLAKRAATLRGARRTRGLPTISRRPALPQRPVEGGLLQQARRRQLFRELEEVRPKAKPIKPRRIPRAKERPRVFASKRPSVKQESEGTKEVSRPWEEAEQLKRRKEERKRFLEKELKARRAVIEMPDYEEEVFEEEEDVPPPLPPREEDRPLPEIPKEEEKKPALEKTPGKILEEEEEQLIQSLEEFERERFLNEYDIQLIVFLEQYGRIIRQFLEKPNSELIRLKMPAEWSFNLEPVKGLVETFNYAAEISEKPEHIEPLKQIWLNFLKNNSKRLQVPIGF